MTEKRALRWGLLALVGAVALVSIINRISRSVQVSLIERSVRPASRIFAGFAYSGVDLEEKLGEGLRVLSPFPVVGQVMPPKFVSGHYYYFHHPPPADEGMRIAQEVLAPRLRAEGFEMTQGADVNGIFYRGFAHLDFVRGGGITAWSIQFKQSDCMGIISYTNAPEIRSNRWSAVRDRWDPSVYVLEFEGSCDL
jgi:hypothetical protein